MNCRQLQIAINRAYANSCNSKKRGGGGVQTVANSNKQRGLFMETVANSNNQGGWVGMQLQTAINKGYADTCKQ